MPKRLRALCQCPKTPFNDGNKAVDLSTTSTVSVDARIVLSSDPTLSENDHTHTCRICFPDSTCHASFLDVGYNSTVAMVGTPCPRKNFVVAHTKGFDCKDIRHLFMSRRCVTIRKC